MYAENEHFKSPSNDDLIIWRYMNFEKLMWMLRDKSLYFCNSEQFEDEFEGSTTAISKSIRKATFDDRYNSLKTQCSLLYRKMIHINCWHMDDTESKGMWDLYTDRNNGIAIKSTLGNLKKAIEKDKHSIFISRIYYLDYEKSYIPEGCMFYEFLCKRNGYSHEKELRALFLKGYKLDKFSEDEIKGTNVITDLNLLINKIILCPGCTDEFENKVRKLVEEYKFDFNIEKSEFDNKPIF